MEIVQVMVTGVWPIGVGDLKQIGGPDYRSTKVVLSRAKGYCHLRVFHQQFQKGIGIRSTSSSESKQVQYQISLSISFAVFAIIVHVLSR